MSSLKKSLFLVAVSTTALLMSTTAHAQMAPVAPAQPKAAAPAAAPAPVATPVAAKPAAAPIAQAHQDDVQVQQAGWSLNEVIARSLETNPQYSRVAKNTRATKEELNQAKAGYYPSLDLRADTGWARTDNRLIGGNNSLYRNSAGLTLTQLLYDGGATPAEINRQKGRVDSAIHRAGETAEFTALDITQAFLEVMRQRELLQIANTNVAAHTRILDNIRTGARGGTVTDGDLSQAEARLAQARTTAVATQEALNLANASFARATGQMPATLVFPNVPRDALPATLDDAINMAKANNPTLAIANSDIKTAEAEADGSDSTLYPRFDLEANASTGNNLNGIRGHNSGQSVLGVMRWNLYRGGADMARKREFANRLEESRDAYADTARRIEKDIRDTWAGMQSASDRANQFKQQAAENQKVAGVYMDQFSLGRRTLLDLLDSNNELFVSRSNYINAMYTEAFAVYRMLALEGKLLNTMGMQRPADARVSSN